MNVPKITHSSYILDETDNTVTVLTLSGHQLTLFKPDFDLELPIQFGDDNELTKYNYNTPDSSLYKILEYHLVRIYISRYANKNFKLLHPPKK